MKSSLLLHRFGARVLKNSKKTPLCLIGKQRFWFVFTCFSAAKIFRRMKILGLVNHNLGCALLLKVAPLNNYVTNFSSLRFINAVGNWPKVQFSPPKNHVGEKCSEFFWPKKLLILTPIAVKKTCSGKLCRLGGIGVQRKDFRKCHEIYDEKEAKCRTQLGQTGARELSCFTRALTSGLNGQLGGIVLYFQNVRKLDTFLMKLSNLISF